MWNVTNSSTINSTITTTTTTTFNTPLMNITNYPNNSNNSTFVNTTSSPGSITNNLLSTTENITNHLLSTTENITNNLLNTTQNITNNILITTDNITKNILSPTTPTNFSAANVTQHLVNLTSTLTNQTTNQTADHVPEITSISIGKYIIIAVCFLSAIVGITGNLTIVIVRIFKQVQRGNTTAYTFLCCQLAIADFIFAFTIIFDIHSYLHNDYWFFGVTGCKFIKLVQSASLTTTVGFLTIMAFERFCGISNPLQHRWSIKKTSIVVLVLWTYIILTFIPFLIALDVQEGYCSEYNHPSESFQKGYTMFLFVTNYMTPLVLITVFHTLIVQRMKKHLAAMRSQRHRGSPSVRHKKKMNNVERTRKDSTASIYSLADAEASCGDGDTNCWVVIYRIVREKLEKMKDHNNKLKETDEKTSSAPLSRRAVPKKQSNIFKQRISRTKTNEDRKLVRMLVAVTLSFALMTLPTQIYYIWYDFIANDTAMSAYMLTIVEVFSSLVYLHCCSNCVIYSAMDKKFRADVRITFRFFFNCKEKRGLTRSSFQRTRVSRLSRYSRHSSSTSATTSTAISRKSEDSLLTKKHKKLEVIEDDHVFLFEKETVIA